MKNNIEDLIDSKIESIISKNNIYHIGKVVRINEFVIEATGLDDAFFFEKVYIGTENNVGYIDRIEESKVYIALVKTDGTIKIGDPITTTGEALEASFSKNSIGMIVDLFGVDRMSEKHFNDTKMVPIETEKIPIMDRTSVNRPLETGISSIDLMFPIGRGQRQLIIGDKKTGKTQILLDTIVNQKNKDVICFYVSIGKTKKEIKRLYTKLVEKGANAYTTIVAAFNDDTSPLIKLTPYAALSMAEEYMKEGKDVLVCIDDLKKHADACREIALIAEKNTGREAYPADIFYTHSRLLEKGCQHKNGGSITILPVVETKGGDITDYVSTNIISITDGQIVLSEKNFKKGQKPAINFGLSVSRLGGAVQKPNIKTVGAVVRRELLSYLETADVYQLVKVDSMSSDLQEKIFRGKKMLELLKQPKFSPRSEQKMLETFNFVMSGSMTMLQEETSQPPQEEKPKKNDKPKNNNNKPTKPTKKEESKQPAEPAPTPVVVAASVVEPVPTPVVEAAPVVEPVPTPVVEAAPQVIETPSVPAEQSKTNLVTNTMPIIENVENVEPKKTHKEVKNEIEEIKPTDTEEENKTTKVELTIEEKRKLLADAKPIELTSTQDSENIEIVHEETIVEQKPIPVEEVVPVEEVLPIEQNKENLVIDSMPIIENIENIETEKITEETQSKVEETQLTEQEENESTKVELTIEEKRKLLADAKPIELTNTQDSENIDITQEKDVIEQEQTPEVEVTSEVEVAPVEKSKPTLVVDSMPIIENVENIEPEKDIEDTKTIEVKEESKPTKVELTIEEKRKLLADAKPIELTSTEDSENIDIMLEKTVLMPRITLEEDNKEETKDIETLEPVEVLETIDEPKVIEEPKKEIEPSAPIVETKKHKAQKVTEEEFLIDDAEIQTNPFEINDDGVK